MALSARQHPAIRVPGSDAGGDLLLPLVDVPQAPQADCAAALHYYEGRWLRDARYLDDYSVFWLRKGGGVRSYSFWVADALWNRYLATGDGRQIQDLLPELLANYQEWEKSHLGPEGLWLRKGGGVRSYSFWVADALWNRYLATGTQK